MNEYEILRSMSLKAYLELAERCGEALSASGARNQPAFNFRQRKIGLGLGCEYHITLRPLICQHIKLFPLAESGYS